MFFLAKQIPASNGNHQDLPFPPHLFQPASQLSILAPTFYPATIITISALISTHAPNCTSIPSTVNATYNSIHHIDIGQQTAWTLDLLLHLNTTQPSSSSLSTAANAPWYKSSSTFSSKFSDSWKYYYFKKYSSSTQCPSSLLWTHCTDEPAMKAPSLIDDECMNMNIEQF